MTDAKPRVVQLIPIDPDQLIDLGHRIKQTAMDNAYPGDSVLIPFTDDITFVFRPEREFQKPLHTIPAPVAP